MNNNNKLLEVYKDKQRFNHYISKVLFNFIDETKGLLPNEN